jgi:hypothetical protein
MLLISSPAHADLDEPSETIEFTRAETGTFPEGLCPGNPLKNPPTAPPAASLAPQDVENIILLDQRIQRVENVVQIGYSVPDFENVSSGAELITRSNTFVRLLPVGYRFFALFTEPEYGLKFMILKPGAADDHSPFILQVIGTQSFMPWFDALLAGHASNLANSRIVRMFTTCRYLEEFGRPLAERGLILTGHSLGGGLAETLAYLIQAKRLSSGLSPLKLELLTFNAFGGKSLVEKFTTYDPKVEATIPARNYFVEGDTVHEIGEHVGPLYDLGSAKGKGMPADGPVYSHLISTVSALGADHAMLVSGYISAPRARVENPRDIATLESMTSSLYALPNRFYDHTKERILEMLNEGLLTLDLTDLAATENRETARFVGRLIFSRELSQRDSIGTITDNDLVRELRSIRGRLYRMVP